MHLVECIHLQKKKLVSAMRRGETKGKRRRNEGSWGCDLRPQIITSKRSGNITNG